MSPSGNRAILKVCILRSATLERKCPYLLALPDVRTVRSVPLPRKHLVLRSPTFYRILTFSVPFLQAAMTTEKDLAIIIEDFIKRKPTRPLKWAPPRRYTSRLVSYVQPLKPKVQRPRKQLGNATWPFGMNEDFWSGK